MLKVKHGGSFIETYREVVTKAREALVGIKAIKKSRLGHGLLELDKSARAATMVTALKQRLGDGVDCVPLMERTAIEVRDIDPMVEAAELVEDLGKDLKIPPESIRLRTLHKLPSGTQSAILEVSTNTLPRSIDGRRVRSGLTAVRLRVLPKLLRCFRCHNLGHLAADCVEMEEGMERCRKCGASDHEIKVCTMAPRCVICVAASGKGAGVAHVAASLGCPANRRGRASEGPKNSWPV